MNTQKVLSALAIALALGVAAPAFADGPNGDPGLEVEQLTRDLLDQKLESDLQPITSDAPILG